MSVKVEAPSVPISAESEKELDDVGCWYSNLFVVPEGRLVRVALVAVAVSCDAT
jgi:hypothetical protein